MYVLKTFSKVYDMIVYRNLQGSTGYISSKFRINMAFYFNFSWPSSCYSHLTFRSTREMRRDHKIVKYLLLNHCHMTVCIQYIPQATATANHMFALDFCLVGGTVIAGIVESSAFFTVSLAATGCRGQSVHIRNKLPAVYRSSSAVGSRRKLQLNVNQALGLLWSVLADLAVSFVFHDIPSILRTDR